MPVNQSMSSARAHPIVRLDYLVRVVCYPISSLILFGVGTLHGSDKSGIDHSLKWD